MIRGSTLAKNLTELAANHRAIILDCEYLLSDSARRRLHDLDEEVIRITQVRDTFKKRMEEASEKKLQLEKELAVFEGRLHDEIVRPKIDRALEIKRRIAALERALLENS